MRSVILPFALLFAGASAAAAPAGRYIVAMRPVAKRPAVRAARELPVIDDFAADHGHGTHVAGTIAAVDNGIGVVGVAPEARLWSVKALDATGSGTNEDVVAAAQWVLAKKQELGGNWIVSMSFGSSSASRAEDEAFAKLRDADVLCVAAAGNSGFPALDYPAAYASVLSVGAIAADRTTAWFSSGGGTLGVMAPGVDVLSTVLPGSVPSSVAAGAGGVRVAGTPFQQAA